MNKARNKFFWYMFGIGAVLFLIIFASNKLSFVLNVFKPVIYAGAIAYLLDGIVRFFNQRLKLNRILSIVITLILVALVFGLCAYYAIPFLVGMVVDLVNYVSELLAEHNTGFYTTMDTLARFFNIDLNSIYNLDFTEIDQRLLETINSFAKNLSSYAFNKITSIGSSVVSIVTSIVLAVYMLVDKEDLLNRAKRLLRALVPEKHEEYVLASFTMANTVFKKFIIGKFIDSSIIGVLMFVLFLIFRIEYAAVFSLVCGIGNMIPYVGPIFSAIPVVGILFIINPWHALIALIIILVVQQLDGNVIGPKILSDNIGVSAFWILFGVTVCGIAFGFIGMVIGVPLVVVVKNLVEDFVEYRLKDRKSEQKEQEQIIETEDVEEDAQEQQSEA